MPADELNSAVEKYLAGLKSEDQLLPTDPNWVTLNLWENFNLDAVWDLLLDERKAFKQVRDLAFIALVAWLLNPPTPLTQKVPPGRAKPKLVHTDDRTRRNIKSWVVFSVARRMSDAERLSQQHWHRVNVFAQILGWVEVGPRYLRDVYYKIGGLKTLRRFRNDRTLTSRIKTEASNVRDVVAVLEYLHASSTLEKEKNTTLNPSVSHFKKISERRFQANYTTKISANWKRYRSRLAVIYSLSLIKKNDVSLLEYILKGNPRWRHIAKTFQQVAPLAVAISEDLLSIVDGNQRYGGELTQENLRVLPKVARSELAPKKLEWDLWEEFEKDQTVKSERRGANKLK